MFSHGHGKSAIIRILWPCHCCCSSRCCVMPQVITGKCIVCKSWRLLLRPVSHALSMCILSVSVRPFAVLLLAEVGRQKRYVQVQSYCSGGAFCAVVCFWSSGERWRRCTASAMVNAAICSRRSDSKCPQAQSACLQFHHKKRSGNTASSVSILT